MNAEPRLQIGRVSIWVGDYPTSEELDRYINPIENSDGQAECRFLNDLGIKIHPFVLRDQFLRDTCKC